MDSFNLNQKYWENVQAEGIPGNNIFPGNELIGRLDKSASILDIGCGSGMMAESLAMKGFNVTAIDINKDTITKNQSKQTPVQYLFGDVTATLPFESEAFDIVILGFVLVNLIPIAEREKAIAEISRVLKKGGLVWLNEGLTSADYEDRYRLSRNFIDDEHSFFVFKDKTHSSSIKTEDELQLAIEQGAVDRISHHFTEDELRTLFADYSVLQSNVKTVLSPRSRSKIRSIVLVTQK